MINSRRMRWASGARARALALALVCVGGSGPAAAQAVGAAASGTRFWAPGDGQPLPAETSFPNAWGASTVLNAGGAVDTRGHPFFTPLGSNGRACVSCHQPADSMSLSLDTIRQRWAATQGRDPMFAMVDGANCPNLKPGERASHSLLLDHGLFRIARAWPPVGHDGKRIEPQFDIQVVRDPSGCNTDATHGLASAQPQVSVFRRPRPAANLKFVTAVGFSFEPKSGLPLLRDPETGQYVSESLMADSRLLTLKAQALDAMRVHLQTEGELSPAALKQMIDFENQVYATQGHDRFGGALDAAGASGGARHLAAARAGVLQNAQRNPVWKEFLPWAAPAAAGASAPTPTAAAASPEQQRWRASVARGAKLFTQRMFLVKDTGGINTFGFGNPVINSCATCHTMAHSGIDVAPGRVDLGTVNLPWADPAPQLPLFKLTCKPGHKPHPFLGREVLTHDPGYALTTGRCEDIGKITTQSLRGLAARAPYFANGSAPTLRALVDFYNRRYNIRLSAEEIDDLVNLLGAL